jgi:hypothetical protein
MTIIAIRFYLGAFKEYFVQSEIFIRYKKSPTVKGKAALSNYYA